MATPDDTGAATPAGGGGAGVTVPTGTSVTIDTTTIESYGKQISDSSMYAQLAQAKLAEARAGAADFTSFPAAQEVFAQHQAVVDVFESTLGLVRDDVETFGANVVQAARSYQQTDDNALSCLQSIATGIAPTSLDNGFEQVRAQHNDTLSDVSMTDEERDELAASRVSDDELGPDGGPASAPSAPKPV